MSKSIIEMNNWNYEEAWSFFSKNALRKLIPETGVYIFSLDTVPTIDVRGNSRARRIIRKACFGSTLILVDGGSNSGKSTFAGRLAKDLGAEIVDVDIMCKDYIQQKVQSVISECGNDIRLYYSEMNRITDEYILKNLENIIADKSKSNKPVILVGMYLEVIYRAIIVKTLGKYFSKVVSLLCLENDFETMDKLFVTRCLEYGNSGFPGEYEKVKDQFKYAKSLLERDNGNWLGVGMTKSFVVDTGVSNQFK